MNKITVFFDHHRFLVIILALALGLFLGWAFFHGNSAASDAAATTTKDGKKVWYTCSMDPSVRQDHPGKCPICGMDLIPEKSGDSSDAADPNTVTLSDEAIALANIETAVVGSGAGNKAVRLFGKIAPDERTEQVQSAYVEGRIERLAISAVGDRVGKGQTLAVIYSPSLYSAEQELVSALAFPAGPQREALVSAATEKLRLLNVTPAQISALVKTRKASPYTTLKANTAGTVVAKQVEPGDYVKQGQPLLKIANLSSVWAMFQAYEADLPFIHLGQRVEFTAEAIPGRTFTGTVSFINPVLDAQSRTAGVRVVLSNAGGLFKPEMLLSGRVIANMKRYSDDIVVPKSAVLWTGKRSVVWVKDDSTDAPTFELREVTLGPSLPDGYVVTDGLAEGEEIVTQGAFAIDASAQLEGKHSMME